MQGNILTTDDFRNTLEPILRNIFYNEIADAKRGLRMDEIITTIPTSKDKVTELTMGDQSQPTEFTGAIAYDEVGEGFKTEMTPKEYAKGIAVQKRYFLTNQYMEVIYKLVPEMMRKAIYHKEGLKTDLLNSAFNTSNFTFGDGLALCSGVHAVPDGSFTQSNLGTTAFSLTELTTIIQIMNELKDYKNDPLLALFPDTIVCSTRLYKQVLETIKTTYGFQTTAHNVNFVSGATEINGAFNIIPSKFLTDQNNFFVLSGEYAKKMLNYYELSAIESEQIKDFDTKAWKYSEYHAGIAGAQQWWAIYGSNVAA